MISQIDSTKIGLSIANSDSTNVLDKLESFVVDSNSLVYSFWLSVIALVLIYLLKKLYIKEVPTAFELIPAVQEFFIDLCMTMIPLIAISCIEADIANFGYFFVFLSVTIISICAYLRRLSSEFLNKNKYWLTGIFGFLCVAICIVVLYIIYHYISK